MTTQAPGWYFDPVDGSRQRWWDGRAWTDHVSRDGAVWAEPLPAVSPVPVVPPAPAAPGRRRRVPAWLWIVIGLSALVLFMVLSPVIASLALVVLITGIVALAKRTPTWLRFRSHKVAAVVTSVAAVVFLITGSVSAAVLPGTDQQQRESVAFADVKSTETTGGGPAERSTPTATPTPTSVQTTRDEVVTETIAFAESTVEDAALPQGQTQIRTAGQNGAKDLTFRVHLVDGVEVSRELISEVVTVQPIGQVVAIGTYVAPAPAPAPAAPAGDCDSNYADACVPISSDVDCAGGSGNGPAYFDGVARVVGSDVYDLDRDGDGYACEPW